jgi:hypothetical protein
LRTLKNMLPAILILVILGWLIIPTWRQGTIHESVANRERTALTNANIYQAIKTPADNKGRQVEIFGQIARDPAYDRRGTYLQVALLAGKENADVVVRYPANLEVTQGDYVCVRGKVIGPFAGETEAGENVETVEIEATSVRPEATETVLAPPRSVWKTGSKKERRKVTVIVRRIEFSDSETRVYVEAKNLSEERVVAQASNSFIKQGEHFYEPLATPVEYKEMPVDVSAKSAVAGILVFPSLDESEPLDFSLIVSGTGWETAYDFTLQP